MANGTTTVLDSIKSQRDKLARVSCNDGKIRIGYFDDNDLFYGVRTNHIEEYVSQRLRGKEVKMQLPEQQTTITYFTDDDLVSFDTCMARLDRAMKIQNNYALAEVFDNECGGRNERSED
jgi:hypothetical protein